MYVQNEAERDLKWTKSAPSRIRILANKNVAGTFLFTHKGTGQIAILKGGTIYLKGFYPPPVNPRLHNLNVRLISQILLGQIKYEQRNPGVGISTV